MNFSLNGTWKKKEAERITYENRFIADRLFSQQSECSKKVFANDYRNVLRYKKLLRRV